MVHLKRYLTESLSLKLSENIEIVSRISKSEAPYWLDKADVFINTTNIDNAPVSTIEAMESGLCVVSTNVGRFSFMLNNNIDSLLVPPNESIIMAEKILLIFRNPRLGSSLTKNAQMKAKQFEWKMIYPK